MKNIIQPEIAEYTCDTCEKGIQENRIDYGVYRDGVLVFQQEFCTPECMFSKLMKKEEAVSYMEYRITMGGQALMNMVEKLKSKNKG